MPTFLRQKNAFTIIEIIISMTVLFIGIVGIFSLFPAAFKMAEFSKATTRMTMVGQSKMEELIAIGFDNLAPGTYTDLDLSHIISDATLAERFQNTQVLIATAEGYSNNEARNPLNDNPLLIKIEVDVRYQLSSGKDKSEVFTTYLSNPTY